MPTITLEKVTKYYKVQKRHRRGENRVEIGVEDVDLTVEQGEFVFLVGSSGAGKSTLLDLISGKLKPDKGTVSLNGKDLARLFPWSNQTALLFGKVCQEQTLARRITVEENLPSNQTALLFGKVCQEQTLARRITVEENLRMAAMIGRRRFESSKHVDERIRKVLGLVGMRGAESKYPGELSIGECRRVELARAMINSPPILVLDEITANLDDDNIWDMIILLNEVNRRGTTVIMATHASKYVNIMRRRVITLVDGHIFGDVARGRYGDVV